MCVYILALGRNNVALRQIFERELFLYKLHCFYLRLQVKFHIKVYLIRVYVLLRFGDSTKMKLKEVFAAEKRHNVRMGSQSSSLLLSSMM